MNSINKIVIIKHKFKQFECYLYKTSQETTKVGQPSLFLVANGNDITAMLMKNNIIKKLQSPKFKELQSIISNSYEKAIYVSSETFEAALNP